MNDVKVLPDEDIEKLGIDDFYLLQKKIGFRFGVDAVILSDFVNKKGGRALDLCSGSGIIPILLIAKNKADSFSALEIIEELSDMINRSIKINKLENKANVICGNLCEIEKYYEKESFDFITVNPPYMKKNSGINSDDFNRNVARFEIACTIDDVARAAFYALKPKGSVYLIHRAYRLVDIINSLVKYKLEPKRMKLVKSDNKKPPAMVLIEAVKYGNRQLNIEPDFIIEEQNDR